MHKKAQASWWHGRIDDPGDPKTFRWHQIVKIEMDEDLTFEKSGTQMALTGYTSDLGTKLNGGRAGSSEGPQSIRDALGNLAVHSDIAIYDAGDFTIGPDNVSLLQKEVSQHIGRLQQQKFFTVLLGGSHDQSYAHFWGIVDTIQKTAPGRQLGVINFDAHLDLRPYSKGPHSGSAFRQVADYCSLQGHRFHYLCAGVQKASNTRSLFDTAHELGTVIIETEDFNWNCLDQIEAALMQFLAKIDYVLLSIDMDGFRACDAPGVSAPALLGYDPLILQALLPPLFSSGKIKGLDIAETNPRYDIDHRTSRLAAALIDQVARLLPITN